VYYNGVVALEITVTCCIDSSITYSG